jgi:cytochrome c553
MRITALIAAGLLAFGTGAAAKDPAARNLAAACAICHGTDGRAATPNVTPLAGLPKDTIAAQLRAFRDGKRPATVMHQIAKGYTDEQIELLAGWFAAQNR